MTYTTTTWTTTSVTRVKADYCVVYDKPGGGQTMIEANLVLSQMSDTGSRRTILGVVDTNTCEVIAATDMTGYLGLMSIWVWRSGYRYATPTTTTRP
jgi:hypothetical protein